MGMRVSIIIPTWQDNQALSRLLENLQQLDPMADEVVVVDGGADAGCQLLCEQYDARWIASEPCRGRQLDQGARVANGDTLWFLHADSLIHTQALQQITTSINAGAVGGYFRFRFSGKRNIWLRWFERLTNWRTQIGTPYGDQGLFVTTSSYLQQGGFEHQPLFEEVRLIKNLRRSGQFVMLSQALATSPRRWNRDGWWRRIMINRGLALAYRLGVPASRLHRWYIQHRQPVDDDQPSTVKASSRS